MIFNLPIFLHKDKFADTIASKNLLPTGYANLTQATNLKGVYYNADGSITVKKYSNVATPINLSYLGRNVFNYVIGQTYKAIVRNLDNANVTVIVRDSSGAKTYHGNESFTISTSIQNVTITVSVPGNTGDVITIYPMVCLASEPDFWVSSVPSNEAIKNTINNMLTAGAPFINGAGKWVYEETSGNTDGSGWYNLPTEYNKYSFVIACPLIAGFQCKVTKSSARWVVRCVDAITTTLGGTSYSLDVGCKSKSVKIGLLMFEPDVAAQSFDE